MTADIGCLAGPTIVLWLQRRGVGLINARRWAFTVGALLMTSMVFVGKVDRSVRRDRAAVPRRLRAPDAVDHGHHHVVRPVPQNEVATVAGIGGFCGNLGVLMFTLLIGGLVKTVGYDPFFVALAVFDILGCDLALGGGARARQPAQRHAAAAQ